MELLKAVLAGMFAAAPVGPVLAFIIQKTLKHGRSAGLVCGIGSCFVDTLYAAVSLFALGFVEDFISEHESLIMIAGGLVVAVIGTVMYVKSYRMESVPKKGASPYLPVQTALCALSNPGALALVMALLAMMGLNAGSLRSPVWLILLCVACGEMLWWLTVTTLLSRIKDVRMTTLRRVNKTAGVVIVVLGTVLIIRGILIYL